MATSSTLALLREAFDAQTPDSGQMTRFAAFEMAGLPHPRAENWRWTDLHGAIRKALQKNVEALQSCGSVTLNGDGVTVSEVETQSAHPVGQLAGALASENSRKAFTIDGSSATPLRLQTNTEGLLSGSQVQILVKPGSNVTLIEENKRNADGLSVDLREIVVAPGAQLTRILICPNAPDQCRINQTFVEVGASGSYRQFVLDFGAQLSRVETHVHSVGKQTHVFLNGAYLLDGQAQADTTSVVRHDHPGCITRQRVKGVVLDKAQAVFQGKFHVAREGQNTDAKMGHHTLLLSDSARVRAKPELEIYADDVACAHGNTTGELDKDALFYMRQRGLVEAQARALLIRAYVEEVFEPLDGQDVHSALLDPIDQWMERYL